MQTRSQEQLAARRLLCYPALAFEQSMTKIKISAVRLICSVSLASCALLAQDQRPGEYPRGEKPSPMMNFFVTSVPVGDGGNLGGLAGADAHCQMLATAVGAGHRTWEPDWR